MEPVDIPQIYYCPITQELMRDPVIDLDGNSYERSAIEDWLSRNNISPLTRLPLHIHDLRPNRALKELIDAVREKAGIVSPVVVKNSLLPVANDSTSLDINVTTDGEHAIISLKPWDVLKRAPCDICCVVDVSGSMKSAATLKNESSGQVESFGLTVLDIVKHAVKTIIHSLEEYDRLSLVSFETKATTIFSLIEMNPKGKQLALQELETLVAEGQTNLWDGLFNGLEVLRRGNMQTPGSRNTAIFLLTDGEPNIIPPRGHTQMLQRYMNQNKDFSCVINTFGFGYSLDSELLNELAVDGKGMYSFIPDSSMVGTAFVNSLSNLMTTMGLNASLVVEPINGATLVPHSGNTFKPIKSVNNQITIPIGSLFHGQSRDFLFQISNIADGVPYLKATVQYQLPGVESPTIVSFEGLACRREQHVQLCLNLLRLQFVDVLKKLVTQMKRGLYEEANQSVQQLINTISSSTFKNEEFLVDLLKDIEGQTMEAIGIQEFYTKWGRHYLPSLMHAHMSQICNNFKDPGVQHYGGNMFKQIRDLVDETFCKLPPPKPSLIIQPEKVQVASSNSYQASSSRSAQPAISSMSHYNRRDYGG